MNDTEAIAVLGDPIRRRLYDYVAAAGHEVGRGEAAEAAGIQRTLAAFHLDKLAGAGLLETVFRRPAGRSGPGAGRPAKLYRRSADEHIVSVPPRDYRTVATLLAEVVEESGTDDRLARAARRHGRAAGAAARKAAAAWAGDGGGLVAVLARQGYEPCGSAPVRLRNCPFHALSTAFPPLVCGMNLALIEGLLDGLGETGRSARMDARPGWCCVVIDSKTNES